MNRRSFLKAGFLASTSALATYSVSRIIDPSPNATGSASKSGKDSAQGSALNEQSQPNQKEVSDFTSELMQTYEIPSAQKAQELTERMLGETRISLVTGAVNGSLTTSLLDNVANGFADRETGERNLRGGVKVSAVSTVNSLFIQKAISGVSDNRNSSSLTKPETLVSEYGLSPEMAEKFCNKFRTALESAACRGAGIASIFQQMLVKPTKPEPTATTPEPAGAA